MLPLHNQDATTCVHSSIFKFLVHLHLMRGPRQALMEHLHTLATADVFGEKGWSWMSGRARSVMDTCQYLRHTILLVCPTTRFIVYKNAVLSFEDQWFFKNPKTIFISNGLTCTSPRLNRTLDDNLHCLDIWLFAMIHWLNYLTYPVGIKGLC